MSKSVKIVDIPIKMQKFYGSGKMLHPTTEMVVDLIRSIPYGNVTLIDSLCKRLAFDYNTAITCPMRTANIIKQITNTHIDDGADVIPFWRVIRNNHLLINSSHAEICASHLENEGFQINLTSKGEFKIVEIQKRLFSFQ